MSAQANRAVSAQSRVVAEAIEPAAAAGELPYAPRQALPRRLRIAFVTPEYVTEENFNGGLANYLRRVSLALLDLGHEPLIVVASNVDETFRDEGIEVHRVRLAEGPWLGRLNRRTRGRFDVSIATLRRSWLLSRRVLQIHSGRALSLVQYPNYTAPGIFRLTGVPSVLRLSSYMPLWQANGTPASRQELFWEDLSIRRADHLFGPSHVIANAVAERFRRPVRVIETPFHLRTVELDETVLREHLNGRDYLLFFGELNVLKGVLTIAGAIRRVLEAHPQIDFVFVGEEGAPHQGRPVFEWVREAAGEHADRVIRFGKMRHAQLYPIIASARAVVLPSRVDNLPNACLEAMAQGRIVIGTRGASFEQLLEDGHSGFLCEKDDPENLAAAIDRALALSTRDQARFAERARARVYRLRPEVVVEQELLSFYRDTVLHQQHRTRARR